MRKTEAQQNTVTQSTPYKKKKIVVVVGNSILYGIETEKCQEDPWTREVCSLPGGQIKDVMER